MSKIYNVGLKAVRLGHPPLLEAAGPGFYINTTRTIQGMVPTLGDWATASIGAAAASFTVNMGQNPFQGDTMGFIPYHAEYDSNLWVGDYSLESNGEVVRVNNLGVACYDHVHNTGKYYFEIIYNTNTYVDFAGLGISSQVLGGSSNLRYYALGMSYLGSYNAYTMTMREDLGANSPNNQWSTYNVLDGDVLQVWADYDNDIMCIKKLDTTKEEHLNYIEQ